MRTFKVTVQIESEEGKKPVLIEDCYYYFNSLTDASDAFAALDTLLDKYVNLAEAN